MPYSYEGVDLREHPEAYEIGRGEQGVFHAQPYKDELLPLWRFKDVRAAEKSSQDIWDKFLAYKQQGDFVGMDVARKYPQERMASAAEQSVVGACGLQMGYTRSRRYAKHKGGTKANKLETEDEVKARCAEIFKAKWRAAADDETYQQLKQAHQRRRKK